MRLPEHLSHLKPSFDRIDQMAECMWKSLVTNEYFTIHSARFNEDGRIRIVVTPVLDPSKHFYECLESWSENYTVSSPNPLAYDGEFWPN